MRKYIAFMSVVTIADLGDPWVLPIESPIGEIGNSKRESRQSLRKYLEVYIWFLGMGCHPVLTSF